MRGLKKKKKNNKNKPTTKNNKNQGMLSKEKEEGIIRCIHQDSSRKNMVYSDILKLSLVKRLPMSYRYKVWK